MFALENGYGIGTDILNVERLYNLEMCIRDRCWADVGLFSVWNAFPMGGDGHFRTVGSQVDLAKSK